MEVMRNYLCRLARDGGLRNSGVSHAQFPSPYDLCPGYRRRIPTQVHSYRKRNRRSAAIQDRDGAGPALDKIRRRFRWLELVWADDGYNAWQVEAAVARMPLLRHGDRQAERRREGLRRPAAPL